MDVILSSLTHETQKKGGGGFFSQKKYWIFIASGSLEIREFLIWQIVKERKTFVTPGVEQYYSKFTSLPGTKSSYVFLCLPGLFGVWSRRYICLSCQECKKLNFSKYTTEYCGKWKFCPFILNSAYVKKLFEPYLGIKAQLYGRKKEKKENFDIIMKLICTYYRSMSTHANQAD